MASSSAASSPGPKKETARIAVLPDPRPTASPAVQMKKTQPLITMQRVPPERSAHRGNEGYERDGRCNSDAALLDTARRFHRDFDYSDLELLFPKSNGEFATINLDESNFDREITQSDKPVIVDFLGGMVRPLQNDRALLDEIAREKAGTIKVAKVNVDENQSLSLKYNIRAIPALLFFKNGQLRDQITGMTSKKDLLGGSTHWHNSN